MGDSDNAQKLKVFISYSREDMDFADELVGGLEIAGLEPTIDRHSIMEGEDWKKRLGALIADADTVVFVLSPASAKSDICAWEVDEAKRLSKRILPVLARPLGGIPAPKQLAELNYVRFDPESEDKPRSFTAGIKGLVRALNSDLDWLREHTRLLARARDWDAAGRAENRLLSGSDIDAAKAWIDARPREAPEPTDLHLAFIQASEAAESARASAERKQLAEIKAAQTAREDALKGMEAEQAKRARTQRRVYAGLAVLALLMAGAGWAVYGQWANLSQNRAQFIAGQAQQELENGDAMTAMLLALEALPDKTSRRPERYFQPYEARAEVALDAALRQQRTRLGRETAVLRGHDKRVTAVAFSPDGARLATASSDNTARLWEPGSGSGPGAEWRETAVLRGHSATVTSVTFSPDGTRLATASWDGTARLWDVATGAETAVLKGHGDTVTSVAFSPDGARLATASDDSTARLWDVASGTETAVLKGHEKWVTAVAFSPDGARLATASGDNTARLWDVATGTETAVLKGHGDWIRAVAFSPDGRRLATASSDNTARLWDVASGTETAVLKGHESRVTAVAFSPDGTRLATALGDSTARLWDVFGSTDEIVAAARSDLHRCLTPAQRTRFFLGANAARWCHDRKLWPYTDEAGAKNSPPPMSFSEYLVGMYDAVAGAFASKARPVE